jgi:hypothetical protein
VVQAMIAYLVFLAASALILAVFWYLQIHYGDTSGLDPENVLVRAFVKGSKRKSGHGEYASISAMVVKIDFESRRQAGMAPLAMVLGALSLNAQLPATHNCAWQAPSLSVKGIQSAGNESMAEPYAVAGR